MAADGLVTPERAHDGLPVVLDGQQSRVVEGGLHLLLMALQEEAGGVGGARQEVGAGHLLHHPHQELRHRAAVGQEGLQLL